MGGCQDTGPKSRVSSRPQSLLLPKAAFVASRLEKAMKGWGTDEGVLVRLLAGLDGSDMAELVATYEKKYAKTLAASLKDELSGAAAAPKGPSCERQGGPPRTASGASCCCPAAIGTLHHQPSKHEVLPLL